MPAFAVSYEVEKPGDEHPWQIQGRIELAPSMRSTYRVVRTAGGGLDVERSWVQQETETFAPLVVPVTIFSADSEGARGRQEGRVSLGGLFRLDQRRQEFTLPVQFEPGTMVFDLENEVYAEFQQYDAVRSLLEKGRSALMNGELEDALQHLREATNSRGTSSLLVSDDAPIEARLELVRLLISQQDFDEAGNLLREVRELTGSDRGAEGSYEAETATQEARLQLLRGEPKAALKKLRKTGAFGLEIEGVLLMVLATLEVGDQNGAASLLDRYRVELRNVAGVEQIQSTIVEPASASVPHGLR